MISKTQAIERLTKAQEAVGQVMSESYYSWEFQEWRRSTEATVADIFGERSRHYGEFYVLARELAYPGLIRITCRSILGKISQKFSLRKWYEEKLLYAAYGVIASMISEIHTYWNDRPADGSSESASLHSNNVFVVHGRDDATKNHVASTLREMGLNPIILHEQANQGRTIIEKFERHSDVQFVVVLMTPDDLGELSGTTKDLKPRARQNVILELGYFVGKLGRERVCILTKGDVEVPSDYSGVVYIEIDESGNWKSALNKELEG